MFKTLKNAWKTPELQKKMLFTLFIVLLYRLGATICVPYVDSSFSDWFSTTHGSSALGLLSVLSGGAMANATLFALSVSPYITASIVMQLLTVAIPPLERMAKNGPEGQKKINMITRFVTVALAIITSYGYSMMLKSGYTDASGEAVSMLVNDSWYAMLIINASFCAGASLVMWLAELINDKGIGNGISIILFANIVAGLPSGAVKLWNAVITSSGIHWAFGILILIAVIAVLVALVGFVVWVTNSERRIPIQYAKRVVGRKMYGGQSTNLPIKLNMSGVMPIIFANSIVMIPSTIVAFITAANPKAATDNWFCKFVNQFFGPSTWEYLVVFLVLIVAFSYFYIMISFNPVEVANNINSNGGSIPGHRPGKPTIQYINRILKRITLLGAFFLCIVAGLPMLVSVITTAIQSMGVKVIDLSVLSFGGSSLLIVIGVALETVRDLEAQLSMRANKGFLA